MHEVIAPEAIVTARDARVFFDQPLGHRAIEAHNHAICGLPDHRRDDRRRKVRADAGRHAQRGQCIRRESTQACRHKLGDVVAVVACPYVREIPDPSARGRVEGQQPFIMQRAQELADEERIAARLAVHQRTECHAPVIFCMQCVGNDRGRVGL